MNGMDFKITLMILDGDGDVGDDDQNVFLRPQVYLDGGGVLQHLCLQMNVVTCRWSAATVRLSLYFDALTSSHKNSTLTKTRVWHLIAQPDLNLIFIVVV